MYFVLQVQIRKPDIVQPFLLESLSDSPWVGFGHLFSAKVSVGLSLCNRGYVPVFWQNQIFTVLGFPLMTCAIAHFLRPSFMATALNTQSATYITLHRPLNSVHTP